MAIVIVLAMIIGIFHGLLTIRDTRMDNLPSVSPSTSLVDFIFFNR